MNMNQLINRRFNMFDRVVEFGAQSGLTLPVRGAALFTEIGDLRDAIWEYAGTQQGGANDFRAGTGDRFTAAGALRESLVEISAVARSLDRLQYPQAAEMVRLPKS